MRFSELDGRRVAVWGAGLETRSFARHFAEHFPGQRLVALIIEDDATAPTAADEPELLALTDRIVRAGEAASAFAQGEVDALVRSPGVSIHRPEVAALRSIGAITTTATGLWLAERRGRNVIGVTATKGKSTTATLIAHLARAAGVTTHLAGNIGEPALDLLAAPADELVVLELSSYQIADLAQGPQTAFAANLYREHLNWHVTDDNYREEKLRLLALPGVEHCVLGALSEEVMEAQTAPGADLLTFGVAPGWAVTGDGIEHGCRLVIATEDLPLPGAHNALNLCGALAALDAHGIPLPEFPGALRGFIPLPHRLERVHESAGDVLWIDDSISTTTESAIVAIESFPGRPIVLLGGGLDRGQDYAPLGEVLAARGATVITMPETGGRLREAALAAGVPTEQALAAADLAEAVAAAREAVTPGAVVLLSPAAPSYHAYRDFKARGEHFRTLARGDAG
ncbi:MAG: UDP-N-acetylmuramoyl-L-alanine--D-glutamate ligase [Solirubrobacteraceae bacterium]|nr:UDP-N-acetylmuramoyl-L-alanine--D-glutamate ligase [Solirubrobacteraceae bacterium]